MNQLINQVASSSRLTSPASSPQPIDRMIGQHERNAITLQRLTQTRAFLEKITARFVGSVPEPTGCGAKDPTEPSIIELQERCSVELTYIESLVNGLAELVG